MTLAEAQRALVDALVAGGEIPAGFDAAGVRVTRAALLRKRAGEVARTWPFLAASFGNGWSTAFATWADGRPPQGSLRDGWDFARSVLAGAARAPAANATPGVVLSPLALDELAGREAAFAYDGVGAPAARGRVAAWARRRLRSGHGSRPA